MITSDDKSRTGFIVGCWLTVESSALSPKRVPCTTSKNERVGSAASKT